VYPLPSWPYAIDQVVIEMKPKLMIFCKSPIPGTVKTRLIPSVGEDAACKLHIELATRQIKDCLNPVILASADVELWCTPDTNAEFFQQFDLPLKLQKGDDLGDRMSHAFESLNVPGILIGIDCPNLSAAYILNAIEKLGTHDAIIGPAEDGGYGLIGLGNMNAVSNKKVFENIPWSTDSVCADTCTVFNQVYKNWSLLPLLWDVDREEDIIRYEHEMLDQLKIDQALSA